MTENTTSSALPTVTGFAAGRAISALRRRGVAIAPLLQRAGLSEGDFEGRPWRRVSAAAQGKFLELAAEAMDDGAFGLHLAEEADPRDAGIVFYVASGARDIGEALALFARYVRIVNEAVRLKLTRTPQGLTIEIHVTGLARHRVRQNLEFGIAMILKALRDAAGRRVRPARVAFAHARSSDLREFERFYLCPVEFGRAANEAASSDVLEFRTTRSRSRSSPPIRSSSKHFNPFATRRRASAPPRREPCGLRSRRRRKGCCRTARRTSRRWRKRSGSAAARSRAGSQTKARHSARSSIDSGGASRFNISRNPAFRSARLRGLSVTRDRPRSPMPSGVGRGVRRPSPGTKYGFPRPPDRRSAVDMQARCFDGCRPSSVARKLANPQESSPMVRNAS